MFMIYKGSYCICEMIEIASVINFELRVVKVAPFKIPLIFVLKHRGTQINRLYIFIIKYSNLIMVRSFILKFAQQSFRSTLSILNLRRRVSILFRCLRDHEFFRAFFSYFYHRLDTIRFIIRGLDHLIIFDFH